MLYAARMNLAIVAVLFAAQLAPATQDEIVFVCNRDGADNICIINSTSLEIRQVTFEKESDALNRGPRWSPDRRKIAFFRRAAGRTDVHIMNSDGTGVTKVTNSDGSTLYRNPAWSPDGTRLAIECGIPNAWQICVVSIDGSGLRKLTDAGTTAASSESPDWLPDGRRIAFHSNRDAAPSGTPPFRGSDIYVMDTDGSNVRRLTVTPLGRTTQNPAWSRDGQRLAFGSTRDGESLLTDWEIYVMDADGTIRRLTNDKKPDGHPRWSPDGRHLVFHSSQEGTSPAVTAVELYMIDADGSDLRRLTNNRLYDGQADW
jgi:TolB protein